MKRSLPLWNSFFALILLLACSSPKSLITKHTEQFYTIDACLGKDSLMQAFLSLYKKGVDTIMQGVLAYSDMPLTKAQPECTMGNLIADAQLVSARKIDSNVSISVVNYGGVRINFIAAGAITRGLVYEVMPFENKIAIVSLSGLQIQTMCDQIAIRKGWPIAGLSFQIKDKKAINIKVNGQAINESIVYKIAINDYVARGGDNFEFMQKATKRFTDILIRDAIIEYLVAINQQHKVYHTELENRISYAE
jgi:2',3'-cyclic-nucleotide 2'-phosphodiesterase (5'-nucleotidase family)